MRNIEYDANIYDTIRKNIKTYRKELKMTAAELAEFVDLSHDFIVVDFNDGRRSLIEIDDKRYKALIRSVF